MVRLKKSFSVFPLSMNRKYYLIVLFAATLAHSLFLSTRGLNCYDEGLTVYGASQILAGKLIYKDIWSTYAPGQYYLLALTFKIFGQSIIVERVLSSLVNSTLIFCVYLLAYKLLRDATALFSWFFALCLFSKYPLYGSAVPTAFLLCLLSCLCIARFLETEEEKWLLLSGILIGLTVFFRHDFGVYLFLSECVMVMFLAYKNQTIVGQTLSLKFWKGLKTCVFLLPGLFVVLGPIVLYLLIKVPLEILFEDLVWFPFTIYSKVMYVQWSFFPDITLLAKDASRFWRHMHIILPVNFMLVVFVLLCVHLMLKFWRKLKFVTDEWFALLLLIMAIAFFNYSRVRSDIYHMIPQILLAIIVLPWLCRVFSQNRHLRFYAFFGVFAVILTAVAFVAFTPMFVRYTGSKFGISQVKNKYTKLEIERARHIEIKSTWAKSLQQAVASVKDATAPEDRIFVGTTRHDKTWANEPMFYFLTERHNATIFNDTHAGLVTTAPIQKIIIEDLLRHQVSCIVLTSTFGGDDIADISSGGDGVILLDSFIKSNYDVMQSFGNYIILQSKHRNIATERK